MNGADRELAVGQRLRALRLRSGLSQRELARRAAVSNATISMIEADRVSPSVSALRQVLSALGVGIADFFAAPEPQGEQVVYRAHLHWIIYVPAALWALLGIAAIAVAPA